MKKLILALICSLAISGVQAQVIYNSSGKKGEAQYKKNAEKKGFDPHKLIFGGGLGLGLGSGNFSGGLSPLVGYRVTDHFAAGVRLGYQYNWIKNGQVYINGVNGDVEGKNLNYHIISPGIWARLVVWNNLYLHTEYELNAFGYKAYQTSYTSPGYVSGSLWDHAHSLLVGLGLRQPITSNTSFVFELFYDALQNIPANMRTDINGNRYSVSPYAGRLVDFRVGLNIGF